MLFPTGTAVFSIVNLIFITQSLSTLDSTFTSAAKLMGPEFTGVQHNIQLNVDVDQPDNQFKKLQKELQHVYSIIALTLLRRAC